MAQSNIKNASTELIAKMLGISFDGAESVRAETYSHGYQAMDLQAMLAKNAELAKMSIELLVDLAHSTLNPVGVVATSVVMKQAEDEPREFIQSHQPISLINPFMTRLIMK
jgi:hypothetical protein